MRKPPLREMIALDIAPDCAATDIVQPPPSSVPPTRRRPLSLLTQAILMVRPVAAPLMRRCPTSTLRTGGRLTVAADPRTQTLGSLQTITVSIEHCIGFEPSYGGAAPATATAAASVKSAHSPIRKTFIVARRYSDRVPATMRLWSYRRLTRLVVPASLGAS